VTKKTPSKGGGTHADRIKRERGAGKSASPPSDSDALTLDEMLGWLRHETAAVSKEAELRIREATAIVADFGRGQISQEEANKRLLRYDERWPDALEGVYNLESKTDEQILRHVDDVARWRLSRETSGPGSGTPPR